MRSSNHQETSPVLSTASSRGFVGGLTTGLVVAVAGQAVGREPVSFGILTSPHLSQSQNPFRGKAVAIPGAIRGKDFCPRVEFDDGLFAASLVAAAKLNRFRI